MAEEIKLTQTIDDREVVKAFQKQNRLLEKMIKNFDQVGKKGKQAGQQTAREMKSATGEALKFAGAVAGVGSVVGAIGIAARQLRTELANIRSRQRDAATTQLTVAQAQRNAIKNFGASPERIKTLTRVTNTITEETGAPRASIFGALSAAVSSKGATISDQFAFNAVRQAARLDPNDPETIKTVSTAILAQKKRSPGTAKQILGFQLAVKGQSPVVDDAAFAKNLAPAISSQIAFGNTPRQSAALLAAFGQGIGDTEGAVTATSAGRFSQQLAEALPDVEGGTFARMKFIRSPSGAKLRARLLGPFERNLRKQRNTDKASRVGISVRAKSFTTVIDLLKAERNSTQNLFDKTLAAIPTIAGSGKTLDSQIDAIEGATLQKTSAVNRVFNTGIEGIRLGRTRAGRAGISRDKLRELLKASGASDIEQKRTMLQFEIDSQSGTVAPVSAAIGILSSRAKALSTTKKIIDQSSGVEPGPSGFKTIRITPTPEDFESARLLRVVVDQLREIVGEQKRSNTSEQRSRTPASKALSRN